MKTLYRIFRTLLVTLLVLPLAVPVVLYITLSIPGVQKYAGLRAEKELTELLATKVSIGKVEYSPFTRIVLKDVNIGDDSLNRPLHIEHLGAGVSINESLWNRRIVITYAEIIDMDARLWRDSTNAPLNIAPIIERFRKKDNKGSSSFDLAINMVVIRRSSLSYDINDRPQAEAGHFDPSHISVSDIRADLRAPRISNDNISIDIKRMGATELSGLTLSDFTARIDINREGCHINGFSLQMPNSFIAFDNIEIAASPLAKTFSPKDISTRITTLPGSHINPKDLAPFLSNLSQLDLPADIEIDIEGSLERINISRLTAKVRDRESWIYISGHVDNADKGKDSLYIGLDRLGANFNAPTILSTIATCGPKGQIAANKLKPLASLGVINILGPLHATSKSLDFTSSIITSNGSMDIDAGINRESSGGPLNVKGSVTLSNINPSEIHPSLKQLTDISLDVSADMSIAKHGIINGYTNLKIDDATWGENVYTDITSSVTFAGHHIEATIDSKSSQADFSISSELEYGTDNTSTQLYANIRNFSLSPFVTGGKFQNMNISTDIDASLDGKNIDTAEGWINVTKLHLSDNKSSTNDLYIDHININSSVNDSTRILTLNGGPFDFMLKGDFSYTQLASDLKYLFGTAFPSLITEQQPQVLTESDAELNLTINPDTILSRFFNLPIEVIYPVRLTATTQRSYNKANLLLDAPYLKQKDKLIEGTALSAGINGTDSTAYMSFMTIVPTKNGPMNLNISSSGISDTLHTEINWNIERATDFHGDLAFTTLFSRDENTLSTDIDFKPSLLVFNDSAWHVTPAEINIRSEMISVENLGASRKGQSITINGTAAADSLSRMIISLDHIDLDYVFETLALSDAVTFGGRATGNFYAEALLSGNPILYTPRLSVENLSYNHCTFGDGDIQSHWDNNTKTITIEADIAEPSGKHSLIDGTIKPMSEELDFTFKADEAPAGFMLPFMSAFTSDVKGWVSGDARLYGTFKDLDIAGDIYVKDLKMKLDFTNTTYTVSDSVHITPGLISFNNVDLYDRDGNKAKLSGQVTHKYFHNPTFKFNITDATNVLVYDISEQDTEDPWHGKIYGVGSATVTGVPGRIDIDVKMRTAPKSSFTFVISDAEKSVEYDFIKLRDRDRAKKDSIANLDPTPMIVRQLRDRISKQEQGTPSIYAMEFNIDITPEATLNLIMDPIGGDKITAHGSGHLRMNYASDGDLEMYGEYTLSHGSYNFTLQDIIIKDFSILEGSTIKFLGDPYAAQLNIRAAYTLNANLSDLDESFLEDRELTRTNVKVNALMIVTGDMRQPDIKFDLEFPTLTADTYRKVRSIISTDEMMSRQIIYLLALNRFYTPEYMATTHGSELVSVASSTLSSRLGSMLGQLSDNWSIAPAIRSDKGDFTDVEVDVALSSQLLDNRLLFNGNLGYRDKSLNNNSFIGDFDIRYLLNRAGTIQLKAYNRYNDQNYYLKSALTTQGVGIVFKRDFDNIFSFLRPIRNWLNGGGQKSDNTQEK